MIERVQSHEIFKAFFMIYCCWASFLSIPCPGFRLPMSFVLCLSNYLGKKTYCFLLHAPVRSTCRQFTDIQLFMSIQVVKGTV
jgi:hypothetical protein